MFRIDLDVAHPLGLHEHGLLERERIRVVACALWGNPQAVPPGEVHDVDHVGGRLGECDGRGALVNSEIPCLPCSVPALVVR